MDDATPSISATQTRKVKVQGQRWTPLRAFTRGKSRLKSATTDTSGVSVVDAASKEEGEREHEEQDAPALTLQAAGSVDSLQSERALAILEGTYELFADVDVASLGIAPVLPPGPVHVQHVTGWGEFNHVQPGDEIVALNGEIAAVMDAVKFSEMMQVRPLKLMMITAGSVLAQVRVVRDADGACGFRIRHPPLTVAHMEEGYENSLYPMKEHDLIIAVDGVRVENYEQYKERAVGKPSFTLTVRHATPAELEHYRAVEAGTDKPEESWESYEVGIELDEYGHAGFALTEDCRIASIDEDWREDLRPMQEGHMLVGVDGQSIESTDQYQQFVAQILSTAASYYFTMTLRRPVQQEVKEDIQKKEPPRSLTNINIRVTIVSAAGLRSVDLGLHADAFCICEVVGMPGVSFKTAVIQGTDAPVWKHQYDIIEMAPTCQLKFTVADQDGAGVLTDHLGTVTLPFAQYYPNGFEGDLPLQAEKKGRVVEAGTQDNGTLKVVVEILPDEKNKARDEARQRGDAKTAARARIERNLEIFHSSGGARILREKESFLVDKPSKVRPMALVSTPLPPPYAFQRQAQEQDAIKNMMKLLETNQTDAQQVSGMLNTLASEEKETTQELLNNLAPVSAPASPAVSQSPRSHPEQEQESKERTIPCLRCGIYKDQVKAASQSLAGLATLVFRWTLANCAPSGKRTELYEEIVNYLEPLSNIDHLVADTCDALNNAVKQYLINPKKPVVVPGSWGDPDETAAQRVRGRLNARSKAAAQSTGQTSQAFASAARQVISKANATTHSDLVTPSRLVTATPGSRGRDQAPRPISLNAPTRATMDYVEQAPDVTVLFRATANGKSLNGAYSRVPAHRVNDRPVYKRALKHLLFLRDGTWVIKDGPGDDVDAAVYAYARDSAKEPWRIRATWQVAGDGSNFEPDEMGGVEPFVVESIEAFARLRDRRFREMTGQLDEEDDQFSGYWEGYEDIDWDEVTFTDQEIMLYWRMFERVDTDGDEIITLKQLQKLLNNLTESVHPTEDVMSLLNQIDPRNNGLCHFNKFLVCLKRLKDRDAGTKGRMAAPLAQPTAVTLRITIIGADHLTKGDLFGNSDPYCTVEVNGKAMFRTKTINDTQQPRWNEIGHVPKFTREQALTFIVWDDDFTGDDRLGSVTLQGSKVFPHGFRGKLVLEDAKKKNKKEQKKEQPAILTIAVEFE